MKQPNDVFNDLQARMSELFKNSPAKDVERNVKAMLSQGFSKLDLVTREEFDTQTQVLVRTRARLEELERRVAELERELAAALLMLGALYAAQQASPHIVRWWETRGREALRVVEVRQRDR